MFVDFIIVLAKAGLVIFALLNLAGLLTWAERKQSAVMQDRVGPNRANIGKFTLAGLLHPVADGDSRHADHPRRAHCPRRGT